MEQLRRQVARARRRLVAEQFVQRLVWCLLVSLAVAAVAVALPRLFVINDLPTNWDRLWLLSSVAVGVLAAAGWTFLTRRTSIDAAIEIDRRFGLRERVASSLSLSDEAQSTDAGRAVVNDAVRAISRIDVQDQFRVRMQRGAWGPLVPALILFVLVLFVDRRAESGIQAQAAANVEKQIKQSAESFRKKIEERRKEAREKGLEEAEGIFKRIEQGTRELAEKKNLDRTKAAVKLNDLTRQLEQRRQQLGGKDQLRDQFKNMKNFGDGPAEKAAQAMKEGDWKKAHEEISKLAKSLQEGKLSEEAKQQLAKQLEQMKQQLQAAADAHQQAMEQLKKQIAQQKQSGNLAKAGELQEKLEQLQQQMPQMERLQQLAQQMGQMQEGLQSGDMQKAAEALAAMAEQMENLRAEMSELEMLDAAMDQLQMAKDAMSCAQCFGEGCEECQGGNSLASGGNRDDGRGSGIGKGRGMGNRPDNENNAGFRDSQVRSKPRQGAGTLSGRVDGPSMKGQVAQSINEEMAVLAAEPADPLTSERLPNSRRQHAEQYFQMLREGR